MKNILIAGASRGIGIEIFKHLLSKEEVNKITAFSRSAPSDFISKLTTQQEKNKFEWHLCDFGLPNCLEKLKDDPQAKLHTLIYNAGTLVNKLFADTLEEDWDSSFQVNVLGAVRLIKKYLPNLIKAKGAHIVLVGSMGGFQGSRKFSGLSCYCVTKGALSILAESLAEELKPYKISVNCLSLGSVDTDMFHNAFPGAKASMRAEEVGHHIADFALNGHHFYNGKIIPISLNTP